MLSRQVIDLLLKLILRTYGLALVSHGIKRGNVNVRYSGPSGQAGGKSGNL